MAEFGVGAPVGKSFEVQGADLEAATANAWRAAEAVGFDYGRSLYSEQIAAGVWEIVLAEATQVGSPESRAAQQEVVANARAARLLEEDRALLIRFFDYLHEDTDTFDPVVVRATLDAGDDLGFSHEARAEMIGHFLESGR